MKFSIRSRSTWLAGLLAAILAPAVGLAWWGLHPRPTLDGVARRIGWGQYRAAEDQLREYLAARPGDELARLLLARVLVDRPDPEPETALELIEGLKPTDPHRLALVRAIEGDAHFWAGRYDRAEPAWLEALRLEPIRPEVGWKLLNVYALQGRSEDSRRLALRLFAIEPDERDRVQLLLQLIRHDSHPIETGSIVHSLEPITKANPGDLRTARALGLALIGTGRADEGLELLRRSSRSDGDNPDARLAYLEGLVAIGDPDELTRGLEDLPPAMAGSPRFDAIRGWLAAQAGELDGAARAYRRAIEVRPTPSALAYTAMAHRFKNVLRQADCTAELAAIGPKLETIIHFPVVVRGFFDRIGEMPDLGLNSHPEEFRKLAAVLAEVGRTEEADAWTLLANRHGTGSP